MIGKIANKLFVIAALAGLSVASVHAGSWVSQITSGSYSGYATVPASQCQQVGVAYGTYPCVQNYGPLGDYDLDVHDEYVHQTGNVAAGTYYVYQYVYVSNVVGNENGGDSTTVFNW